MSNCSRLGNEVLRLVISASEMTQPGVQSAKSRNRKPSRLAYNPPKGHISFTQDAETWSATMGALRVRKSILINADDSVDHRAVVQDVLGRYGSIRRIRNDCHRSFSIINTSYCDRGNGIKSGHSCR
jgi:hypothetical protein